MREIINPRFHLSTPLVSGLFYIAPGVGFICGSIVGGQLSDRTVKRYIVKRDGVRIPKDRLNSGLVGLLFILPASMLIFGWTLQKGVGGLALLIVSAFWIGVGLVSNSPKHYAFITIQGSNESFHRWAPSTPSTRTQLVSGFMSLLASHLSFSADWYLKEVSPTHRSEVIGAKYIMQYLFSAASTAAVIPLIHAIGVGAVFTICMLSSSTARLLHSRSKLTWLVVVLDILGGIFVIFIVRYMQEEDTISRPSLG